MGTLTRGALVLSVSLLAPATLSVPATLLAQQGPARSTQQLAVDNELADELTRQARSLERNKSDWGKAAALHARSGKLRGYGDARAYASYQRAAHLYSGRGNYLKSRRMFELAGERALESGKVFDAAMAFADAAETAELSNDGRRALANGSRVLRLSESPAVTDVQRRKLLARVVA